MHSQAGWPVLSVPDLLGVFRLRELLTRREAAETLAVSASTVARLCAAGVLVERRVSERSPRVTRESVERVLSTAHDGGGRAA